MQIINRLKTNYNKPSFLYWGIPLALLAACFMAFGLLIPWLGYYHDEWHFIYYEAIRGTQGLVDLFNYDGHPLAALVYILSFKLIGLNPIAWHLYSLIWRWLAVTMFWRLLDLMWPGQKRFTFTAALIFTIYPLFALQVLPISYFEVWIGFFLFFLSLYWTGRAIIQPKKFWFFACLAIFAKLCQMLTSEYTWGMEMMRPIIIWILLAETTALTAKIKKTTAIFLPYLVIFFSFAIWRSFFYQAGRKEIAFQSDVLSLPLSALLNWLRYAIPDFGFIVVTSWYKILDPAYLDVNNRTNLFLLVLIIISTIGFALFLKKLLPTIVESNSNQSTALQAIIIGCTGFIFGLLPSYMAGYIVYLSDPPGNARFALGAIPGAALLITGFLELAIHSPRARNIMIATLVGLSIGWHVRYTNEFRDLWKFQVNFYRQLTWRVPAMKPGTALVSVGDFFPAIQYPSAILAISGDYPTAMAINTIYAGKPGPDGKTPYWFFPSYDPQMGKSGVVNAQHLDSQFSGVPNQTLYFTYMPQDGQCLRLYAFDKMQPGADQRPLDLDKNITLNSFDGIDLNSRGDFSLLDEITGPPVLNTWCYIYENAELSRQKKDWDAISKLWDIATLKHLTPAEGREYIPFIVSLANLDNWQQALALTRSANKITEHGTNTYCQVWRVLEQETPSSAEKETVLAQFRENFACQ